MVSTQWHCLFMYLISRQFCQRIYTHTLMHILCQLIEWFWNWLTSPGHLLFLFICPEKFSTWIIFSFHLTKLPEYKCHFLKNYFFHQLNITLSVKSAISFPQDYHVLLQKPFGIQGHLLNCALCMEAKCLVT